MTQETKDLKDVLAPLSIAGTREFMEMLGRSAVRALSPHYSLTGAIHPCGETAVGIVSSFSIEMAASRMASRNQISMEA